jgi:hypothetical protein
MKRRTVSANLPIPHPEITAHAREDKRLVALAHPHNDAASVCFGTNRSTRRRDTIREGWLLFKENSASFALR